MANRTFRDIVRPSRPLVEPGVATGGDPLPATERGGIDRPALGILFAVLGMTLVSFMDAGAKHLAGGYPVGQIAFFRNFFALLPLSLLLWHHGGLAAIRTRQPALQVARGVLVFLALTCFFAGLRHLGLAETTAIAFAAPLFITALSRPLLGEAVGPHRWLAVLVGFAGVALMLRPGSEAFQVAALFPLAAALFYALAMISTRRLSRTDSTPTTAVLGTLVALALCSATLPFDWVTPTADDLWVFVFIGLVGGCGTYCMVSAYRLAPAAVVAPFDYTALVWAVVLGWLLWQEVPSLLVWLGTVVVIGSGLYILRREAVKRAQGTTPLRSSA